MDEKKSGNEVGRRELEVRNGGNESELQRNVAELPPA